MFRRPRSFLCTFQILLTLAAVVPIWLLSNQIGQLRLAISRITPKGTVLNSVAFLQSELTDSERDLAAAKAGLEKERARQDEERPRTIAEKIHDPGFQANLRRSVSLVVNSRYSALFSSLNLDPKRFQRLKDMLSERTIGAGENVPSLFSSNPEVSPPSNTDKFRSAIDDEIRSVLHGEEYVNYRAYEATLPARNLVDQIQRTLGAATTPMTTEQAAEFMVIASNQHPDPQQKTIETVGNRVADILGASTSNISDDMMQRASALLTKDQLDVLIDMRSQQDAREKLDLVVQHIESAAD